MPGIGGDGGGLGGDGGGEQIKRSDASQVLPPSVGCRQSVLRPEFGACA